jgi:large subunit ribosomal protein L23
VNDERILTVLKQPHISEKATIVADKQKQFVFKVVLSATKSEIKAAVEKLFDVKVKDVTTVNIKGKTKRFRQRIGKRSDIKKAYVTLLPEYDIDFTVQE